MTECEIVEKGFVWAVEAKTGLLLCTSLGLHYLCRNKCMMDYDDKRILFLPAKQAFLGKHHCYGGCTGRSDIRRVESFG